MSHKCEEKSYKTLYLTVKESPHHLSNVINIKSVFQAAVGLDPNQKAQIRQVWDQWHPFVSADIDGEEITKEDVEAMIRYN